MPLFSSEYFSFFLFAAKEQVIKIYKSIILPTVYTGVKHSFTVRDITRAGEQSAKEESWTYDQGKLHNDKLYELYSLHNIIRVTK
jgi:hypothetical protein